jgi:hypothetical protein
VITYTRLSDGVKIIVERKVEADAVVEKPSVWKRLLRWLRSLW